jgi:hypothetical protein
VKREWSIPLVTISNAGTVRNVPESDSVLSHRFSKGGTNK